MPTLDELMTGAYAQSYDGQSSSGRQVNDDPYDTDNLTLADLLVGFENVMAPPQFPLKADRQPKKTATGDR